MRESVRGRWLLGRERGERVKGEGVGVFVVTAAAAIVVVAVVAVVAVVIVAVVVAAVGTKRKLS